MRERSFTCSDGMTLAAQWYDVTEETPSLNKILLLHGWLDNSGSFWKLAPQLHKQGNEILALDLPGHGKSGHKSQDAPGVVLAESLYYVAEVLQQMGWNSEVILIGHSMGASIALMYAASFPDQVKTLILLEGAGPVCSDAAETPKHIRAHIERRMVGNISLYHPEKKKSPRVYPSFEKAVETRQATAKRAPGNQYLSKEAASVLVLRATEKNVDGGVRFIHDPRLLWPSIIYTTDAQLDSFQQSVQCPTALFLAKEGWPFDQKRLDSTKQRLQPKQLIVLPGSHHFHADPTTADAVAEHIIQFLSGI